MLLSYKDSSATQHPTWNIKDNLYDNATNIVTTTGNYQNYVSWSNNGYVNYTTAPVPTALRSPTDVPQNSGFISFSYAPTVGDRRWYQASTDMINKGSRSASAAGLYHHTVRPENVKEGEETTATVDIGFHYPAAANVALRRAATQSSTEIIDQWGACKPIAAGFALDGGNDQNWDGITWNCRSISCTKNEGEARWEVDLGVVRSITCVNLWRPIGTWKDGPANFYVFVSENPFQSTSVQATLQQAGVTAFYFSGQAETQTRFPVGRTGRYIRVQLTGTGHLWLAEVQVFTSEPADDDRDGLPDVFEDRNGNGVYDAGAGDYSNWKDADTDDDDLHDRSEYLRGKNPKSPDYQENIALNKTATQWPEGDGAASRAVDGTIDGDFNHESVTRTGFGAEARWQVDLGSIQPISWMCLWNRTDCCAEYLADFYVFVSDSPFQYTTVSQTLLQPGVGAFYFSGQAGGRTPFAVGRTGRYVRVQLKGTNYVSLAEVQVFTGEVQKLALNQAATSQKSTYGGAVSGRAVDGNTDGDWSHNSVTHTQNELGAWWQVDLGAVQSIASINLWNRTDCCGDRLTNFYVFVSDNPFLSTDVDLTRQQAGVTSFYFAGSAGMVTSLSVGRTGRYLRVQLTGQNYLSLAEVQVLTGEAPTFAIGVLPDLQMLAATSWGTGSQARYNNTIDTLRDWIPTENLKAVLSVGDAVHVSNPGRVLTPQEIIDEWTLASDSWKRLQGQCLVAVAAGNHEREDGIYGSGPQSYPSFNSYFGGTDPVLSAQSGLYSPDPEPVQNHYGGVQNAYWRRTIAGLPFLFLTLEFNTTITPWIGGTDWSTESQLIGWARGVVSSPSHQNDLVVLVTHDYNDWPTHLSSHGQYLWDKLVSQSPNMVMVMCGHMGGSGLFQRQRPNNGSLVNELLFDYQGWDGVLYPPSAEYTANLRTSAVARLMTIDPLSNRVRVKQWGCEMGGWLGQPADMSWDGFEFTLPADPRQ